jgi:hypothetical protein
MPHDVPFFSLIKSTHPDILKVYGLYIWDNDICLVMEDLAGWKDGHDLLDEVLQRMCCLKFMYGVGNDDFLELFANVSIKFSVILQSSPHALLRNAQHQSQSAH